MQLPVSCRAVVLRAAREGSQHPPAWQWVPTMHHLPRAVLAFRPCSATTRTAPTEGGFGQVCSGSTCASAGGSSRLNLWGHSARCPGAAQGSQPEGSLAAGCTWALISYCSDGFPLILPALRCWHQPQGSSGAMFVLCHTCTGVSDSGSGTPSLLHPQLCPSRALALSIGSWMRLAAALSSSLLACQGKSHPEYRSCRGCACLPSHTPAPQRSVGDCAGCGE